MKFSTNAVHAGSQADKETGAIMPPIYMTSTYKQANPGEFEKYDYSRGFNPNYTNLEKTLAALEGAKHAAVFSSGLGALSALMFVLLKSGDKVIAINDLYGGTYRLFNTVLNNFGVKFELVDLDNEDLLIKALKEKPKLLILESPTNPLLRITDIKKITKLAKSYGVITLVDNTFASPYFQKPLELGADIVLHSSTKYIAGHSDVLGGAIISNNEDIIFNKIFRHMNNMERARNSLGFNPSPFDTWLILRGVKTLALRMEKHQKNALDVAKFFQSHSKVRKVYYPGLTTHPNHIVAKKQMSGFSGMVSVEFDLSFEQSKKLVTSFKIITLAESLGGVESLVDHPASMTHGAIPKAEREKAGLMDGLMRFSIGIEDVDDLIADLQQALEKI